MTLGSMAACEDAQREAPLVCYLNVQSGLSSDPKNGLKPGGAMRP